MKVKDLYFLNIKERRMFLEHGIKSEGLNYEIQTFHENGYKGFNFLVLDWFRRNKPNIVITAHYDGFGAYDNAGGTIGLLWLLKWIRCDNLESFNNKFGLVAVFTDGEERGVLGARYLLKHDFFQRRKIHGHLSLDGFGIGTHLGVLGNMRKVKLKLNSEYEAELDFKADTTAFQDKGIPSLHLFSLPYKELNELVNLRIFPPCWRIVHTKEDTPDKVDEEILPFIVFNLYGKISALDFKEQGVFILK